MLKLLNSKKIIIFILLFVFLLSSTVQANLFDGSPEIVDKLNSE